MLYPAELRAHIWFFASDHSPTGMKSIQLGGVCYIHLTKEALKYVYQVLLYIMYSNT